MSNLNVAIVGYGKYGKKREKAINQLPHLNLVAIVDESISHSTLPSYQRIAEVRENVDLFFLATPNCYHQEITKEILNLGKRVICEKPLCISSSELREFRNYSNLELLQMGSNFSYFPAVQSLLEYITANNLKLQNINIDIGHNNKGLISPWHWEKEKSGGGTLIDNGIHALVFLNQFLSNLKVVKFTPLFIKNSIEEIASLQMTSTECPSIELCSSWNKPDGYAQINISAENARISCDLYDDFITVNDRKIKCSDNTNSLLKETELLSKDHTIQNFHQVETVNRLIFDSYQQLATISIVVPAHNEEENLRNIVTKIHHYFATTKCWKSYEVVICDDNSHDNTPTIAKELCKESPLVRLIQNSSNRNLGGIFQDTIKDCKSDFFIMIQGQDAISADGIHRILDARDEADLIIPYQMNTNERPFVRRILSKVFNRLLNIFFSNDVRYFNHYVLSRTKNLQELEIRTTSYAFQAEIILKLLSKGHTYINLPVRDEFQHKSKSSAFKIRNILGVARFFATIFLELHFTGKKNCSKT